MHVESNWHRCLVLSTGTKCRRLVWHWTVTWRISAWSSTVRNYPLSLSRSILHRSSLASAFTMWEEGSVRYLGQGAKCGQHSSHLGKCSVLFFSSRNLTVFLPLKIGKKKLVIWYLNCLQNLIWKIFIFAPPSNGSVSQKNSSPSSNEIMQQNGRLFGDGTPPTRLWWFVSLIKSSLQIVKLI